MQVMLQVQSDAAQRLRHRLSASVASQELLSRTQQLGVTLRPLRVPAKGSALSSGFTVEVPDRDTAERVIQALKECEAVEAAYFVPQDALP